MTNTYLLSRKANAEANDIFKVDQVYFAF